jgi:hypothetical protein
MCFDFLFYFSMYTLKVFLGKPNISVSTQVVVNGPIWKLTKRLGVFGEEEKNILGKKEIN